MLTPKQNFYEVLKGGNPDHFIECFEPFAHFWGPSMTAGGRAIKGGPEHKDRWGVISRWPDNAPGAMPIHTPDKVLVKDITHWRDYVKAPTVEFTDEEWENSMKVIENTDPEKQFIMPQVSPGLFELTHSLCGIEQTLYNLVLEPESLKDLIKYLTEYELKLAETLASHIKMTALFHHDDVGSQISTFMSPDMWAEFYLDSYKEIYKYYRDHGVEVIVHHSDSYGATFVPNFIEMGVDVWQGCLSTNDLPSLVKKYGGKMTFMGGIDSGIVDRDDITDEKIDRVVKDMCDACGPRYFIPCLTAGGKHGINVGVYERVCESIGRYSKQYFK